MCDSEKDITNLLAFIWIALFATALLVMDCLDGKAGETHEDHHDRDHIQG